MNPLLQHIGTRVEVFLDLSPGPKRWIVRQHLDKMTASGKTRLNGMRNEKKEPGNLTKEVGLTECVFRVNETRRKQCQKDRRGYVDAAWVIGTLVEVEKVYRTCTERVTWNYNLPTFVLVGCKRPIETATKVLLRFESVDGEQKGRVYVPQVGASAAGCSIVLAGLVGSLALM